MIDTNYKFGEVHSLSQQITPGSDSVRFHNVFHNANGGVALVAFEAGQKLDTHNAPAEVMVYILEGRVEFTLNNGRHILHNGDFLLIGADVAHSVAALEDSKLMLIKVKP